MNSSMTIMTDLRITTNAIVLVLVLVDLLIIMVTNCISWCQYFLTNVCVILWICCMCYRCCTRRYNRGIRHRCLFYVLSTNTKICMSCSLDGYYTTILCMLCLLGISGNYAILTYLLRIWFLCNSNMYASSTIKLGIFYTIYCLSTRLCSSCATYRLRCHFVYCVQYCQCLISWLTQLHYTYCVRGGSPTLLVFGLFPMLTIGVFVVQNEIVYECFRILLSSYICILIPMCHTVNTVNTVGRKDISGDKSSAINIVLIVNKQSLIEYKIISSEVKWIP